MIQMAGGVAFGIGEHGGGGGVNIEIVAAEHQHRKRLSFEFIPVDREDLTSDELLVVLAFDTGGSTHEERPT
jgi:hypothetical protein